MKSGAPTVYRRHEASTEYRSIADVHLSARSKPFRAWRIPITTSQKTKQNKKYSLCGTSKRGTAQKKTPVDSKCICKVWVMKASLLIEYKIIRQGISHRRKPLHSTGTQPSAKGQGTKLSGKTVGVTFCSWVRGRRQPSCSVSG